MVGPFDFSRALSDRYVTFPQSNGESAMRVKIKKFNVDMDVKNAGIEFQVHDNDDNFKGDCFVTKTGLVWCHGKTKKENGVPISWTDFIAYMESR